MDRLTYRLLATSATSRAGHGTLGILRRLADADELADGRIVSVDAPASAVTRLLETAFADQAFTFPARSWAGVVRREGKAGPDVFLADREREVEVTAVGGIVQVKPLVHRLRTADGLFAGIPDRCSLLHVNDGRYTASILRGAQKLLTSQRPLVLIGACAASEQDRLDQVNAAAALLASHEYTLLDSTLLSADSLEHRREAVITGAQTGFLAIPRERDRDMLVRNLFGGHVPLSASLSGDELLVAGLIRAAELPQTPVERVDVAVFDASLICDGFHAAEALGDQHWRWSGPFAEARAYLPLRHPGSFGVELGILNAVRSEQVEALRLYVDGDPLAIETHWHGGSWLVHGRFTAPVARFRGWCELRLAYGSTTHASKDDPRRLGLCVSYCKLQTMGA